MYICIIFSTANSVQPFVFDYVCTDILFLLLAR